MTRIGKFMNGWYWKASDGCAQYGLPTIHAASMNARLHDKAVRHGEDS